MTKLIALSTAAALAFIGASVPAPANAQGAFDFLDSCIKIRSDFAEQRQAYFANLELTEKSVETMAYTPQFKDAWMKEVRKQARPLFDEKVAPRLREMGATDMEKAFDVWFHLEIAAVKPEDLEKRITADFRALARDQLRDIRGKQTAQYDKAQSELGDACKSDVGSQVMRVALAPLGWVAGNFESAKDEKNIVTQVFKAATGISPQAIAENGLLGGSGSEARKVLEPVIGGPKGAIQQGIGDATRALNPGNWRF